MSNMKYSIPKHYGGGWIAGGLRFVRSGQIFHGQTGLDAGSGFWIGYDHAGNIGFSVGDGANQKLVWDGSLLTLRLTEPLVMGNVNLFFQQDQSGSGGSFYLRHLNDDGTTYWDFFHYATADRRLELGDGALNVEHGSGGDVYTAAWTEFSASTQMTGWSSLTEWTLFYRKIGKLVFVQFLISGVSDTPEAKFTLPYPSGSILNVRTPIRAQNNGAWVTAIGGVDTGSNIASFYTGVDGSPWGTGGTKRIEGQFFYEAA